MKYVKREWGNLSDHRSHGKCVPVMQVSIVYVMSHSKPDWLWTSSMFGRSVVLKKKRLQFLYWYAAIAVIQFNIKLQPKLIELIFPLTLHQNRKLKLLFLIKRRTFGHFHIRVFSEHFFCWHHVWSQQFVFIGAEWDSNGQDRNTYEVRRHQSTAFLQAPATDSARTGIRRSRTLVCLRRRPQGRVHEFKRNRKRIRRVCHISPVKQWGGSYVHYVRSNWSAFTVCHCTA